jgi:hypothetical protein
VPLALDDVFGERILALAWHPERRRTPELDAFTELICSVCASDLVSVSPRPGLRRG